MLQGTGLERMCVCVGENVCVCVCICVFVCLCVYVESGCESSVCVPHQIKSNKINSYFYVKRVCDGQNSMLGVIPTVHMYIYESLFS